MIEDDILKSIDSELDAMTEATVKWASINSGSYNVHGVTKVSETLWDEFSILESTRERINCEPAKIVSPKGDITSCSLGPVLSFTKRLDAPLTILLAGHMDTVFPEDSNFQNVTIIDKDKLLGPGLTDMKGGVAVILWALKFFEQSSLSKNIGWQVLLTPDEEIGSPGSGYFLNKFAKEHDLGFVYEPSIDDKGTLAGQRKGSGKFTIVAKGVAAHVGREFQKGRSAIYAMANLLGKIDALNNQREGVTVNAGIISGGEAVNAVADTCTCFLDVRLTSDEDQSWLKENLDYLVSKEINGVHFSLHGKFTRPAKIMDDKHNKLYSFAKEVGELVGENISWKATGGCCDGNNLSAAGLPNIDTLGVRGGKIHSSEEYLIKSSLTERVKLTYGLLTELASRGLPW